MSYWEDELEAAMILGHWPEDYDEVMAALIDDDIEEDDGDEEDDCSLPDQNRGEAGPSHVRRKVRFWHNAKPKARKVRARYRQKLKFAA